MISLEVSIARFIDVLHSKAFVQHPLFPIVRLLVLQSQSRICNEHTSSGRGVPTKKHCCPLNLDFVPPIDVSLPSSPGSASGTLPVPGKRPPAGCNAVSSGK